jgi:pseudaminic acid synthase
LNALTINGRRVGWGESVYVVAEMSANHHGRFDEAVRILRAAKEAGADAVKLQTYTADTMTIPCDDKLFRAGEGTLWEGRTLYDLYKEAHTPWDWQPRLKEIADGLGLDLFSSPFDASSVEFLEKMRVPVYKIASFELVDIPLIRLVAGTGKPVIMSTGMASASEIEEAVSSAREAGAREILLLKCTSAYPAPPDEIHLRTLPDLAAKFQTPVGLSDHTLGIAVPLAAAALGACLIEKHITMSRAAGGPDGAFSLEPQEFKAMVEGLRAVEKALGGVRYGPGPHEARSLAFRRSLFVVRDMRAGETFTAENVRAIRPGHGLHTRHLGEVLGRRAAAGIRRGTPLAWTLVEGGESR